jgi:sugar/nucleoside kinase (ribokinase family)
LRIDFLVIGHITHDRTADGYRLGGTVSYAAVTARRLGRQAAILTRASADGLTTDSPYGPPANAAAQPGSVLEGVAIHLLPSPVSTTFVNLYRDGQRTQVIEALADPIHAADLPAAWADAPIVLLGPIAREIPAEWTRVFPNALIGVTPQGWMREWDAAGHVRPTRWADAADFLACADVLILSREDAGGDDAYIAELASHAALMVVTDGWHGATVYRDGVNTRVPPRLAAEVDPTGAGDVFAAAFLIRLAETDDPLDAARFANIVASMSVEAVGMDGIPDRRQVEEWLATHGP